MGILAFLGAILVVLAVLVLVGVLHIAAGWVTLLIIGLVLIAFSALVWDVGPGPGVRRGWRR